MNMFIRQTFEQVELVGQLSAHKNGAELVNVMKSIYTGNPDHLFYQSDRGDCGAAPEAVRVFVCKKSYCVLLATITSEHMIKNMPILTVENREIDMSRDNLYRIDINFGAFNPLYFCNVDENSKYIKMLRKIKMNLLIKCFYKVNENELSAIFEQTSKKIKESEELSKRFQAPKKSFNNDILAFAQKDGSFYAERMIYGYVQFNSADRKKSRLSNYICETENSFHTNRSAAIESMLYKLWEKHCFVK